MTRGFGRHNGFTLVELLVVIAVISVLAALLMPALVTAIETADVIACLSNQKQTLMGLRIYADENPEQGVPWWCRAQNSNTFASHGVRA